MARTFEHLVPFEYSELLRQTKTSGEVAFVCRVMLQKRIVREDTIRQVCRLYGLDFGKWSASMWIDSNSLRVAVTETEGETKIPF